MRVVQNSNNIIRVLKLIYSNPGISRIEISKQLGLDRSTITVVVNRLSDLKLIEESRDVKPIVGRGRSPIGLKLCDKTGVLLGIEIRTDSFVAVFVSLDGTLLNTTVGIVEEYDDFFDSFEKVYKSLYNKIQKMKLPLLGVGVAISGIINSHKGIIIGSNPLGIYDSVFFYEKVKSYIKVPIFIENDANCGCWGELNVMNKKSPQDLIFVLGEFRKARSLGDSTHLLAIGLGIVIDNKVHYGKQYLAGEYQSPQYIEGNKTQFSISNNEIELIQSDLELINKVKCELSRDLAFLVNVLNLTQITIGGDLVQFFDILKPCLESEIQKNSSYKGLNTFTIEKASKGIDSIALGAASMLRENLFITYENNNENPWEQKVGIDLLNSFAKTIDNYNSTNLNRNN